MPSSTLRRDSSEWSHAGKLTPLWIGVFAGPLMWAALLETNYVLSYVACEQRHKWMLHLATAIAILVVAAAGFLAWRAAPPLGGGTEEPTADRDRTRLLRARFMGLGAVLLSAWFILVMLSTEIVTSILEVCS
jgi:hypothetical protein